MCVRRMRGGGRARGKFIRRAMANGVDENLLNFKRTNGRETDQEKMVRLIQTK